MKFTAILAATLLAISSQPAAAWGDDVLEPCLLKGMRCGAGDTCCADLVCRKRKNGTGRKKCRHPLPPPPPPPCGLHGQQCCPSDGWNPSPYCKQDDLTCDNGWCKVLQCGGPGQECCPPDSGRDDCQSDHECVSGRCEKKELCGIWDKPPCPGSGCEEGLEVNGAGLCDMPCGGEGEMCCNFGDKCDPDSLHPLTCGGQGKCVKCGGTGQRVCNGNGHPACGEWLIPDGNTCTSCGKVGERCCDQGRPETPESCESKYATCSSGHCRPCGWHNQPVCNNGYFSSECAAGMMRMGNMCMRGD